MVLPFQSFSVATLTIACSKSTNQAKCNGAALQHFRTGVVPQRALIELCLASTVNQGGTLYWIFACTCRRLYAKMGWGSIAAVNIALIIYGVVLVGKHCIG